MKMGRQLQFRHLARTSANVVSGRAVVLVATTLAILSPAAAEKRVALVIGNSAYSSVPALANPRNDAEGIGAALNRLGFEITVALDADRAQMEKSVKEFAAKTETADVALFYYAGHGLQHQGVNYLIPTDASLQSAAGLRRLIKLNDIVADVRRAKAIRILVLDACRDNPLGDVIEPQIAKAESGRSRSVGLAKLPRSVAKRRQT